MRCKASNLDGDRGLRGLVTQIRPSHPCPGRLGSRRTWILAAVIALFVAACGGGEAAQDDDGASVDADTGDAETTEEDAAAAPVTDDGEATQEAPAVTTTETSVPEEDEPETTAMGDGEAAVPLELSDVIEAELPERQPLGPGRYRDDVLTSRAVLEVDDALDVAYYDSGLLVLRQPAWGEGDRRGVLVTAAVGVMPPEQAGIHQPHEPAIPETVVAVPDDLGSWLTSIEQIELLDSTPIELAGGPATVHEFSVREDSQTFDCNRPNPCVGLISSTNGVHVFQVGLTFRLYEFDDLPGLVAWGVAQGEIDDATATEFDDIVGNLRPAG